MSDVFTSEERSRVMGRVRSRDTTPERVVGAALRRERFRFEMHREDLPGKPDFAHARRRKIVFVHGCFWHGHPGCPHAQRPASRRDYWDQKLDRNRERDRRTRAALRRAGWDVLIVWECETRRADFLRNKLVRFLARERPPHARPEKPQTGRARAKVGASRRTR